MAPYASIIFPTALALLAALLPSQGATDTIVKKDGSSLRGVEVTSFSLATVKYKRDKEEIELPGHTVVDVRWGGVPDAFQGGLGAMQRADFDTARQLFGDAVGATERPALKQEARFLQGKAAAMAAAADPAAAANAAGLLRAWLTEFADGWRVPEAMFLLGRSLRLGGMPDDGTVTLKQLDERTVAEGWGLGWSARAKFEMALCLMDKGKTLEARSAFQSAGSAVDTALAAASNDPELRAIKVNARVGEGESLVREKDYARAADFFRTLANNDDPALAAAGKAGEGEALFLLNAEKKDQGQLRQAQVALAEACVLDAGASEASAKANYYLGRVLLALGERHGNDWKARADAYFQIVLRSYSGSRWVAAAKAEAGK